MQAPAYPQRFSTIPKIEAKPSPPASTRKCIGCSAEFKSAQLECACPACWKLVPRPLRHAYLVTRKLLLEGRSRDGNRLARKIQRLNEVVQDIGIYLRRIVVQAPAQAAEVPA